MNHDVTFEELFNKIKSTGIFSKKEIISDDDWRFKHMISPSSKAARDKRIAFFQIAHGELYFMIIFGNLYCIYSKGALLGSSDVPRDDRINSLKSISLEELLDYAPKEKAVDICYHLDIFKEHLQKVDF